MSKPTPSPSSRASTEKVGESVMAAGDSQAPGAREPFTNRVEAIKLPDHVESLGSRTSRAGHDERRGAYRTHLRQPGPGRRLSRPERAARTRQCLLCLCDADQAWRQ